MKSCYKVSLCENFQRQGCSVTVTLLQSIDIGAKPNPPTFSLKVTHTLKVAELARSLCHS